MSNSSLRAGFSDFPRILFIHDYRPDSLATADLLRQLFRGYPAEKIDWWYCRETGLHAQPAVRAGNLHSFLIPDRLVPHVRQTALKSWLVEKFWLPRARQHLERTIARVKPDLVAGLLYGWSVPVLTHLNRPPGGRRHFSIWDFPDTNGMKRILGEARSQRYMNDIYRLLGTADSFDVICQSALAEIRIRTSRSDGLVVHSGFEPQHLAALEKMEATPDDDELRLAYAGTIISDDDFLAVIAALKKIRKSIPRKVVLEFFGARNYRSRDWFEPEWMKEHGMFTDEGLVTALRRCVWGIVVTDSAGVDLRYSRFSFPNKVGTYLSAGVPVLGFGHPTSSLARIMQNHRPGRFSAATTSNELEKFLAESLRLPAPRTMFRDDILRCARTEFNAAAMRAELWQLWGAR
jgi:hypothetical protein